MATDKTTPLTEADKVKIGDQKVMGRRTSQKRKTAGSLLNAGSEAQLSNGYVFSTLETAKPPRHRKPATTPRSKWVEVADFCDRCAGTFHIHAPKPVASRAHVLWTQKHKCERAQA